MADRLTREAIDERLRVLGGVDEVVNRCIDELTRMRSVLPPVGGTGGGSVSVSASAGGPALAVPEVKVTSEDEEVVEMNGEGADTNGEVVDTNANGHHAEAHDENTNEKLKGKERAGEPEVEVEESGGSSAS